MPVAVARFDVGGAQPLDFVLLAPIFVCAWWAAREAEAMRGTRSLGFYLGDGVSPDEALVHRTAAGAVARKVLSSVLGDAIRIRAGVVQLGPHRIPDDALDFDAVYDNALFAASADVVPAWEEYLDGVCKAGSSIGAVIEIASLHDRAALFVADRVALALARAGAVARAWELFEEAGYPALAGDPAALAVKELDAPFAAAIALAPLAAAAAAASTAAICRPRALTSGIAELPALAMAMAIDKGSATMATVSPASASARRSARP